MESFAAVWVYGAVFGLVHGMQGALMGSGYAHYCGRDHIGAIKGFAKTVFVGGTAAGPLIFAIGSDWLGSYTPALLGTVAATAGIAITLAFLEERTLLVRSQAAFLKSATSRRGSSK